MKVVKYAIKNIFDRYYRASQKDWTHKLCRATLYETAQTAQDVISGRYSTPERTDYAKVTFAEVVEIVLSEGMDKE